MTLEELEARLIAECDAAIAEGWTVAPGDYFPGNRKCCALGAVVRDLQGCVRSEITESTITRLSLSEVAIEAIADGFDGHPCSCRSDAGLYRVGRRLRQRYLEVPHVAE